MDWTFTEDLGAFASAAGPAVAARPAANTVLLSTLDRLTRRGLHAYGPRAPRFGWWAGPDGAVAAAVWTPPHPLVVTGLPPAAALALVRALTAEPLLAGLEGVNAARADAELLAGAWGRPTRVAEELRLYRLAGLVPPDPAPAGGPRPAGGADVPLVLEWLEGFRTELGMTALADEAWVADRLSYGGITLWEDGGRPVSLACRTRRLGGATRIGPVYTPRADRGRGYAAGATAEASRLAPAGEVLLFTDLANPTSNALYQRLGYTPVMDRLHLTTT
ncbi:GNAT family N-acetyltransferase [Streptomyces sp. NPDC089919]|uniref:GNAT family N-acetyltransferase n=1 Tax=Streptomyces sp. NPDC089919 TaxID=3155188 RepID=UPI00341BC4C3